MLILGIDTSCDDTSAALLDMSEEGGVRILSNIVSNQSGLHNRYGGIVPEIASRSHIEMIWPVVESALGQHKLGELGAVAVCHGPGLIGSLLVGCSFAKSLCYPGGLRLVTVNHLEGHLLSSFLLGAPPEFPFLSLVVSGGHTSIYKVTDFCQYEEIGRTRDDAAGEAYDKISKMLGLEYPGGPLIDKLAKTGNPKAVKFPRTVMPESPDFSFSGMKTAVRVALKDNPSLDKADVAAAFQEAMVHVLVKKTERALRASGIMRLSVTGGVAANSELRARMGDMCKELGAVLHLPSLEFCTDNAAMIAYAGYHRARRGEFASLDFNPRAHLPL